MSKSHPRWRLAKKILTWVFFIAVAVLLVVYAQKVDWEEVYTWVLLFMVSTPYNTRF